MSCMDDRSPPWYERQKQERVKERLVIAHDHTTSQALEASPVTDDNRQSRHDGAQKPNEAAQVPANRPAGAGCPVPEPSAQNTVQYTEPKTPMK